MSLNSIVVSQQTDTPPVGVVVLLHGWGANSQDLASLVPFLNLPDCEFICPEAPFPHPHVPNGKMWYDLEQLNYTGLTESQQLLTDWLTDLESSTGVPLSRTILAGFSQGGAMTLDVGLTQPLAGLISMSGYLHVQPQRPIASAPPVLILHGVKDPIVPLGAANQARSVLMGLGIEVQYQEFKMEHEICQEELGVVRDFIQKKLALIG
jgi:phospholipase/carboxylesterase